MKEKYAVKGSKPGNALAEIDAMIAAFKAKMDEVSAAAAGSMQILLGGFKDAE